MFVDILIWIAYFLAIFFIVYWLLLLLEKYSEIKKDYSEKIVLKDFPFVSVLVPAYNEEKTIHKTLASLVKLNWPKNKLEIIVIDDGSSDKTSKITSDFIKNHPNNKIILMHQKNSGKARALNNALKLLKSEYFSCLDADSSVDPDILKRMIYWHKKDKNIAITTPIMKIYNPKNWIQKFQKIEYISGMLLAKLVSLINANYVAPGPFSTYKTHIIKELGGFDEHTLVEDQEIAYKAQKNHYKIIQVPKAVVYTICPSTLRALKNQRNRWFKGTIQNLQKYRYLMFRKKYGDFGVFQLPIVNVFSFLLGVIAIVGFISYTVVPLFRGVYRLWLVNFDLLPYFSDLNFTFDFLALQIPAIFVLIISFILGLLFLFVSSYLNEDDVKKYSLYIIPFFFLYFIFMSFVIVIVIGEILIGKKQKW